MTRPRDPLPTRIEDVDPPPAEFSAVLDAGLDDLGLRLSAPQRAAIQGHVALLLAWNRAINLTAIHDPADVARLHVLDSLSAVPTLARLRPDRLLDLGSGGGFPGLPLAIALGRPALLVDSVGKKVRFLATVAEALGRPDIASRAARAEALAADPAHRERWPAVTVRAVGPLAELVELAFPLLRPGGTLVAWKRGGIDDELRAAGRAVDALGGGAAHVAPVAVRGLAEHRLVVVRKRGRTGAGWPRDPAARRRRPW